MGLVERYLAGYSASIQSQVSLLVEEGRLQSYIESKYSAFHTVKTDSDLREYVNVFKNTYLKRSAPVAKVIYDSKIRVLKNALGMHSYVSKIQGNKIKSKNEIRISSIFKDAPEAFLEMIVVHELAHIKEKHHNKSFYRLCQHMLPDYMQIEFDCRLYLICLELT